MDDDLVDLVSLSPCLLIARNFALLTLNFELITLSSCHTNPCRRITSATRSSSAGLKLRSGAPTRVLRIAPLSFRPVLKPPRADALAEEPGSPWAISSKKHI